MKVSATKMIRARSTSRAAATRGRDYLNAIKFLFAYKQVKQGALSPEIPPATVFGTGS
jgi:hypothetical protein